MSECVVVHLGRESRLLAVTVRTRRESDGGLIVDFAYRGQVVPLTEIRLTSEQARALADEITGGLLTRLTNERDEALDSLNKAVIRHGFAVPRSWTNVRPAGGGALGSTGPIGGSIPPPSTSNPLTDVE